MTTRTVADQTHADLYRWVRITEPPGVEGRRTRHEGQIRKVCHDDLEAANGTLIRAQVWVTLRSDRPVYGLPRSKNDRPHPFDPTSTVDLLPDPRPCRCCHRCEHADVTLMCHPTPRTMCVHCRRETAS